VLRLLGDFVEQHGIGEVLSGPGEVYVDSRTSVQPDVFVLPLIGGLQTGDAVSVDPLLVVEVLSPATARHDRLVKRALYQRRQVEYWIIDLDAQLLERWLPGADRPEIWSAAFEWRPSGTARGMVLDLPRFCAAVLGVG